MSTSAPAPHRLVHVHAASGGLGCTTLASALASAWSDLGLRCSVVEDPHGGGDLQLVSATDEVSGLRWDDLAEARGAFDGHRLLAALPRRSAGPSVLAREITGSVMAAGSRLSVSPPSACEAVTALAEVSDVVVLDHGVASATVPWSLGASSGVTVLLAGLQVAQIGAAYRARARLRDHEVVLVVRAPAREEALAASLAESLGVSLLGRWGHDRGVRTCLRAGLPPRSRPTARLAADLLTRLDDHRLAS